MFNMNLENIKGKRVLIVGMGKSGIAAAQAMLKLGANVTIQDSKEREKADAQLLAFLEGKNVKCYFHQIPEHVADFDMIILSPGVNPELDFIQEAEADGAEIVGELEIAYRIARGRFVAITGTNGKTTTTTLVGEIFRNAKRKTHVVGNIGVAVISKALEADEDDWLVTETSSFQLQTIKYFKPEISAILNLTPDHLNRHHTMEAYGAAKARIFENQDESGYCIVNYDDKLCYSLTKDCRAKVVPFSRLEELEFGAFLKGDMMVIRNEEGELIELCSRNDLKIIGDHNVENALAAAAICYFAGIDRDVIVKTLTEFAGVEHRIEYSGEINGIKFYNDSKGTNVDAAIIALKAIKKNIILIAGGDGKGQSFDELIKNFDGRVKHMILLGRDGRLIAEAADRNGFKDYTFAKDMPECVNKAFVMAEPGDTVLLSPACASWDMYDNFEQRGEHFKECVKRLGL
ncbi:MAG: UDP-N-acetylmuramoyl-L-alanine--D-glutamate ligase [Anaerovoracaceae bacterium]|mgnify:CR=1 FL=1|nr:UDP-N-acetylmuramoyl-L-alanine--D-glutamate ligase [Bacillota bacterium]MDY5771166.1 UDP-N-acetylmuramoyl-L-alanine--D-glutamate ligase [Anaerovoracaceae bacterium]